MVTFDGEKLEVNETGHNQKWGCAQTERNTCFNCKELLRGHRRCAACTILIHSEKYECDVCPSYHTESQDGVYCQTCTDYSEQGLPKYNFERLILATIPRKINIPEILKEQEL